MRRNADSNIYIYCLNSQNNSLMELNKCIIHLYGNCPYLSMFTLALGQNTAEEKTVKMHVCLTHLPNMLAMSSGSQSFSSLVNT